MISINDILIDASDSKRKEILSAYIREIASLHKAGQLASLNVSVDESKKNTIKILQKNNIKDYAESHINNLIECLSQLYPKYDRYLPSIITNHQNNSINPLKLDTIKRSVYKNRNKRQQELTYCFNNNDKFTVDKCWNRFQVIQKKHDSSALRKLLAAPDQAVNNGIILKESLATTVSLVTMSDGKKVIIKRFNSKGVLYSMTRSFITSRARNCWRAALHLTQIGVSTPYNLAMLEVKSGPWIKTSYLVTELLDGIDLAIFATKNQDSHRWQQITKQVEDILFSFPSIKTTHGDFKSTNFTVDKNSLFLIDLDSLKTHNCSFIFKISYLKNINRFERNWVNNKIARDKFQPIIKNIRNHITFM